MTVYGKVLTENEVNEHINALSCSPDTHRRNSRRSCPNCGRSYVVCPGCGEVIDENRHDQCLPPHYPPLYEEWHPWHPPFTTFISIDGNCQQQE